MHLTPLSFLESDFPYYINLTPRGKKKFLRRLNHIAKSKAFYGHDGLQVTSYMCYYISACWVALTFGFKEYTTEEYTEVHIYPEAFYSEQVQGYVKGLTTGKGIIFLSWKDFVEDYSVANNLNVGLHELTHAILISAAFKSNFDDHFSEYYKDFFANTKQDFIELRLGSQTYLRKYGGENMVEFLSVCVECFFERPADLKLKMPVLYYNMCVLFNQNPLNISSDYKLDRAIADEIIYSDLEHGIPDYLLEQYTRSGTFVFIEKNAMLISLLSFGVFAISPSHLFLFLLPGVVGVVLVKAKMDRYD